MRRRRRTLTLRSARAGHAVIEWQTPARTPYRYHVTVYLAACYGDAGALYLGAAPSLAQARAAVRAHWQQREGLGAHDTRARHGSACYCPACCASAETWFAWRSPGGGHRSGTGARYWTLSEALTERKQAQGDGRTELWFEAPAHRKLIVL